MPIQFFAAGAAVAMWAKRGTAAAPLRRRRCGRSRLGKGLLTTTKTASEAVETPIGGRKPAENAKKVAEGAKKYVFPLTVNVRRRI